MSRAQGVHGSGGQGFTAKQYAAVLRAIEAGAETVEAISDRTGLNGRAVRAALSAADGVDLLLGGDGNGCRLARTPEEAERLTARFASQVKKMQARIDRRRAMQRTMRPGAVAPQRPPSPADGQKELFSS